MTVSSLRKSLSWLTERLTYLWGVFEREIWKVLGRGYPPCSYSISRHLHSTQRLPNCSRYTYAWLTNINFMKFIENNEFQIPVNATFNINSVMYIITQHYHRPLDWKLVEYQYLTINFSHLGASRPFSPPKEHLFLPKLQPVPAFYRVCPLLQLSYRRQVPEVF